MKPSSLAAFVTAVVAGTACAPGPFVRTDGPVGASGVVVALVSQKCERRIDPSWTTLLAMVVEIRVTNTTSSGAVFDPAQIRLVANGEARQPRHTAAIQLIPPNTSRTFFVDFFERDGALACNLPMALSFDGAAALGTQPVRLPPIAFLAETSDV
jgi:hypothetical protein